MGRRREPGPDAREAAHDRRYVTALARGLDVLRCFTPRDRWLKHQETPGRGCRPWPTTRRRPSRWA